METSRHARGATTSAEENALRVRTKGSADKHQRDRDNVATNLHLHSYRYSMEQCVLEECLTTMRFKQAVLALSAVSAMQGCVTLESLGPSCMQEQLIVTWPVTITRGASATSPLLTTTLTPSNVDRAQFDALRQVLVEGTATAHNVTWTIPAFDVNGGYIALSHAAPLASGETQQVSAAFEGGGWGAQPTTAAAPPAVAVRANNFIATSATGSITALASSPLRLHIDITTANANGETIRLTGDVGFHYDKVKALCT
jgi:hypothetical protein